jgi:hypothetical protein
VQVNQDAEIVSPDGKKMNRAKKEQLRRSRMNQFFDELKALLPVSLLLAERA